MHTTYLTEPNTMKLPSPQASPLYLPPSLPSRMAYLRPETPYGLPTPQPPASATTTASSPPHKATSPSSPSKLHITTSSTSKTRPAEPNTFNPKYSLPNPTISKKKHSYRKIGMIADMDTPTPSVLQIDESIYPFCSRLSSRRRGTGCGFGSCCVRWGGRRGRS